MSSDNAVQTKKRNKHMPTNLERDTKSTEKHCETYAGEIIVQCNNEEEHVQHCQAVI